MGRGLWLASLWSGHERLVLYKQLQGKLAFGLLGENAFIEAHGGGAKSNG